MGGDLIDVSSVTKSLEEAFDQIDAFRTIHEPGGVTMDAVLRLQEAVCIDDEARLLIRERLYEGDMCRDGSTAFLGLIIGLLAAQFDLTEQ